MVGGKEKHRRDAEDNQVTRLREALEEVADAYDYCICDCGRLLEEQEFAESKKAAGEQEQNAGYTDAGDGFMSIPDGVDEQLPFA